jgi:hypothetical protein
MDQRRTSEGDDEPAASAMRLRAGPAAPPAESSDDTVVHGVMRFLGVACQQLHVRGRLQRLGYTEVVHRRGYALAERITGLSVVTLSAWERRRDQAIERVAKKSAGVFAIVRGDVTHRQPAQGALLLDGIGPGDGIAAVLDAQRLLDRLDALERGEGREATQEADLATVAILAERRIDAERRAELRALVEEALVYACSTSREVGLARIEEREAERAEARHALRDWLAEWSAIARVAIKNRQHLIWLGVEKGERRWKPRALGPQRRAGARSPLHPGAGDGACVSGRERAEGVSCVMSTKKRRGATPPERVADGELPFKAIEFSRAIAVHLAIRDALSRFGFTRALHAHGWDLALRAVGRTAVAPYQPHRQPGEKDPEEELEKRYVELVCLVQASVAPRHPTQAQFLLHGLDLRAENVFADEPGAVVTAVETLLERLAALEGNAERAATRDDDHAALAILIARGVTAEDRATLREWVDAAKAEEAAAARAAVAEAEADARRQPALDELRAWYEEWAAIARRAVARRDHLARLGLVELQRRPRRRVAPVACTAAAASSLSACDERAREATSHDDAGTTSQDDVSRYFFGGREKNTQHSMSSCR